MLSEIERTKLQLADELWSSGRQLAAAEEVANVLETSPNDIQAALRLARALHTTVEQLFYLTDEESA